MSHYEILLIAVVVMLLFSVPVLAQLRRPSPGDAVRALKLWVAQGFGIGRIPVAPGTFGSIAGIVWFALLLLPGNLWFLISGMIAGIAASVWLCGEAERTLGKTDPGSVVLDEIAAMPLCFGSWIGIFCWTHRSFPGPDEFFSRVQWPLALAVFALFRFFDVVKPWPVRGSQSLPGGWGVTVDDLLAAVYVNIVVLLVWAGRLVFYAPTVAP